MPKKRKRKKPRKHPWTPFHFLTCGVCGKLCIKKYGVTVQKYCPLPADCALVAKRGGDVHRKRYVAPERAATRLRMCLRCGVGFQSTGISNRVCKKCSTINQRLERTHADAALMGGFATL
jgi:hypothetical protein